MSTTAASDSNGSNAPSADAPGVASISTESDAATLPAQEAFALACAGDRELVLACRFWTGGIRLGIGDQWLGFTVVDGEITGSVPAAAGDGVITVTGSADGWAPLLTVPQPRLARLAPMTVLGVLDNSETERLTLWQYLPALERTAELLRGLTDEATLDTTAVLPQDGSASRHDNPVGRYVHVELGDSAGRRADYRLYYEEAGDGIPLLAQHTAGAQSLQWRHLFERSEITDRFRLVAYDLPYHGKSLPPHGLPWWCEDYRLEGAFLRQVPVALSEALGLDRPVFLGCSVGGMLALDLALRHPDEFRAVISVGGALHVGGDWDGFAVASHPAVSSHAKARLMESLCDPDAPTPYVKEVSHVYSAAWPPAFWGDLYYYMVEHDLRERAHEIDTSRVGVHILSGEHDWSGLVEHGQAAHEAIAGSTFAEMAGIGHFAMQEQPEAFIGHLLSVLDRIEADVTF